ncbi:MAG: hypothetical protein EZS28_028142 [Streblomastix strix]|uniref:Uncharacterized protein n=1 Tax=Streblomastix strix TaxID=222440 RepID=A0A5J4V1R6_9EUKA|nr:MAG: hypothetical protein EZS28_028142 [Streblomastix strix]
MWIPQARFLQDSLVESDRALDQRLVQNHNCWPSKAEGGDIQCILKESGPVRDVQPLEATPGKSASAQLSDENCRNMRLNVLTHGNSSQDSMIRANMGHDLGTGVHNNRIIPDTYRQPQRNSFNYNSQILFGQRIDQNKQSIQGNTSNERQERIIEIIPRELVKWSGGCQNDNLTNGLVNQVRPEVSFPPSDSLRTTQTFSNIRSGGNVQLIQGNAFWNPTFTNIFHRGNEQNPSGSVNDIGFANNQLLGLYSPITPGLIDLETTNNLFDGNIRTVWSNNLVHEVRTGTETGVVILKMDLELGNNGIIYADGSVVNNPVVIQVISKDNFEQPYYTSKISGSDN